MALVTQIKSAALQTISRHTSVDCTYTVVIDAEGKKPLQLDTYGFSSRAIPGKKSQSLRFSKEALTTLKQIIDENGL